MKNGSCTYLQGNVPNCRHRVIFYKGTGKRKVFECFNIIEHYYLKGCKLTLDLRKEALFQETHLLDF